jgi:hypothetical protein
MIDAERMRAIRTMRFAMACSALTCIVCVFGAYLARSPMPLSGIPSNVLALFVGRFAIRHLRRVQ